MKIVASAAAAVIFVACTSPAWAIMRANPGSAYYNTASGYKRPYMTPKTDMAAPKSRKKKVQH